MTDTIKISRELRPVLSMILNALDRDSAEGKAARGEMAAELRALLATPPADAADMGGQAGEEVGLNGLIVERDIMGAMHIKLPAYDGGAPIDLVQIQYRYPYTDNASTKRLAEKIAGLISGKLEAVSSEELAQHRQQAGKLVEAIEKLLAELAHMGIDERYRIVLDMRKTLADLEKTNG